MIARRPLVWGVLALSISLSALPVHALSVADVPRIAAQSALTLPLPINGVYDIRTLNVESVGVFRDGDGSQWLRVEGSAAGDEDASFTVLVDAYEGQVEMGLVVNTLELADIGVRIEQLRAMAKAGQGQLVHEGRHYSFSGAARSQFVAGPGAAPVKLGYFILQCDEDPNLSLMVLAWGDRAEVLVNERLDPSQARLGQPGQ